MGYVPTGGSGGASIGGTVTGATAGSVFFAGAAGVMAQDNTRFFWDDTNFNLIAGGATYRTILGQMSSPSDNYSGIRFAGAGEAVLGTSNAALWGGANATVLNVPSGTIYFRVGVQRITLLSTRLRLLQKPLRQVACCLLLNWPLLNLPTLFR